MNIEDLTIKQVRELLALVGGAGCGSLPAGSKRLPMPIGTNVFIITVTRFYTGRVTAIAEEEVELDEAAWIADTGRFTDAMKAVEKLNEIEPYPGKTIVNRGLIADWSVWPHELPRSQK